MPLSRSLLFNIILLIILTGAAVCHGEEFHNALSLQGFTGLFNTPNAEVTEDGKFYALYTNQKEYMWRNRTSREESYIFSVGLLPFLEIGGRLTDAAGLARDLSGNFKIKAPLREINRYLPDIAFGMQDVGGGAKYLQSKYLVATEEIWRFRLSLGYGGGPDRMEGLFGGLEFRAFDWLYLIGENDTKETNVGIRLVTPNILGVPLNLQVSAKTSLDYRAGHTEFGIGLQFPLDFGLRKSKPKPEVADEEKPSLPENEIAVLNRQLSDRPAAPEVTAKQGGKDADLRLLRERLTKDGFQNVRIGSDSERMLLVVEYENARYNHNELDGLGVVVGIVSETVSEDFEMLQLVVRKKGISVIQMSAPLSDFQEFINGAASEQLNENLDISLDVNVEDEVKFTAPAVNRTLLKSELVIYPGLKTFVGTEVGNFDYLLSLKLDYFLNLWKGAVLNARWDIPLEWSENFDEGRAFDKYRRGSQTDRLMFFQALKVAPGLMFNIGAGMVFHDTYGTINEMMWLPGNGNHLFMLKQAYASSSDEQAPYRQNSAYLASYRYYFSPLELYLEGAAGQFMDKDRGFRVDLKRFFGDTAFSLYYKDSQTATHERVQVGGVEIAFPLTPRRDMKPYPLRVRGTDEWSYSQETKIVTPGGANSVAASIGVEPTSSYNLKRVFLNRDRLSEEYIRRNLWRLRNAYEKFGQGFTNQ